MRVVFAAMLLAAIAITAPAHQAAAQTSTAKEETKKAKADAKTKAAEDKKAKAEARKAEKAAAKKAKAAEKKAAKAEKKAKLSDGKTAAQARQKQCGEEWKDKRGAKSIEKGMTWPKYYSACSKRLKEKTT